MRQCETEKGPKQMVEGCRSGVILPGAPSGEVSSRKNERKLSESGRIGWMISKQGTFEKRILGEAEGYAQGLNV